MWKAFRHVVGAPVPVQPGFRLIAVEVLVFQRIPCVSRLVENPDNYFTPCFFSSKCPFPKIDISSFFSLLSCCLLLPLCVCVCVLWPNVFASQHFRFYHVCWLFLSHPYCVSMKTYCSGHNPPLLPNRFLMSLRQCLHLIWIDDNTVTTTTMRCVQYVRWYYFGTRAWADIVTLYGIYRTNVPFIK